jgi:outer membrane biogenesis lipoprotein LolB
MKHLTPLLLCALALLCACARQPVMEAPSPEARARLEQTWQRYVAADDAVAPAPYRLQLSLRFGTEGDTRRVTALFWGNGQRKLRMDVMAGVGATVANILEDGQHFLVFAPNERKAYFHQGANKPLLQVGVPTWQTCSTAATPRFSAANTPTPPCRPTPRAATPWKASPAAA